MKVGQKKNFVPLSYEEEGNNNFIDGDCDNFDKKKFQIISK